MKYIFFLVVILCVAGTQYTQAHGLGTTLGKTVGDYIVDVDYDAIAGIYAGDPVQFTFQLFNKDRSQQLDFNDVRVSITPVKQGETLSLPVFDGGIVGSTFPPSGMTFVFPNAGSYTLNLRYEKGEKAIAEASFPLDVQSGSQSTGGEGGFFRITNDFLKGVITVVLILMLIVIGRTIFRKRKE